MKAEVNGNNQWEWKWDGPLGIVGNGIEKDISSSNFISTGCSKKSEASAYFCLYLLNALTQLLL